MSASIPSAVQAAQTYFATGITKPVAYRIAQLKKLKQALLDHEQELIEGLYADLHKAPFDAYLSELYLVIKEINYAINHLNCWMQKNSVRIPLIYFPARSYILHEPLGVVLIIGTWNYPLQLTCIPLINALAAGNCTIIKPSEYAPYTARIITKIIKNNFDSGYINIINGDAAIAQKLTEQPFDHIFFTGGIRVGKLVMEAAAHHLTPVTLELGGKNPCIVTPHVSLSCAAKRIAWGKFLNAGQNCTAPDYVLIHESIKKQFIEQLRHWITLFYSESPEKSPHYGRIINQQHFDRLYTLLHEGTTLLGGQYNRDELYIAPTVLDSPSDESTLMSDEIFGPLLPLLSYTTLNNAIASITRHPKPLAIYIFSNNQEEQQKVIRQTSSGSIGINDVMLQASMPHLPFGGVGASGFGRYHGKAGFDLFSNQKVVFHNSCWFDLALRYPLYRGIHQWLKKLFMVMTH
jgi:aldehyde dehydrogenase (NAD+)